MPGGQESLFSLLSPLSLRLLTTTLSVSSANDRDSSLERVDDEIAWDS